VKYPLDRVCVKSGIFCPSCQRKIDNGEVKPYEVEVIRLLMELEDKVIELRKGEYIKSYMVGNTLILVLKGEWERAELDKLSREIGAKLDKRVKIAILTSDQRSLVEQILSPIRVLSLNIVWLPDGSEQISVRIPSRDVKRLGNVKQWEEILSEVLGKPTRIIPE